MMSLLTLGMSEKKNNAKTPAAPPNAPRVTPLYLCQSTWSDLPPSGPRASFYNPSCDVIQIQPQVFRECSVGRKSRKTNVQLGDTLSRPSCHVQLSCVSEQKAVSKNSNSLCGLLLPRSTVAISKICIAQPSISLIPARFGFKVSVGRGSYFGP